MVRAPEAPHSVAESGSSRLAHGGTHLLSRRLRPCTPLLLIEHSGWRCGRAPAARPAAFPPPPCAPAPTRRPPLAAASNTLKHLKQKKNSNKQRPFPVRSGLWEKTTPIQFKIEGKPWNQKYVDDARRNFVQVRPAPPAALETHLNRPASRQRPPRAPALRTQRCLAAFAPP